MTPSVSSPVRERAAQFVKLLQRLGPIFIKAGQFLALRPDLLPQEYCDELLKLVDRVPPFPWAEAEAILTRELGRSPSELFVYFNRRPVAAGSLAQVHFARLKDGSEVAVKVQRPNIEAAVRRDLKRARLIANLLEKSGAAFIASPRAVAEELRDWMLREIDFRRELTNMARLRRLAADSAFQRIPLPYPAYSTSRVLTAQFLHGIPVSSVLQELRSSAAGTRPPRIAQREVDCQRYAERLLIATLTQMFRYQFFHADLHPGNLLILPGDVVGFVDFGLCDELDEAVRQSQFRYLAAVYSGEPSGMFRALTEILIPSDLTDMEAFRRDFLAETQILAAKISAKDGDGAQVERSPIAAYLIGVMRAARRNRLQVPTRILAMYRALLTVETVANQLGLQEGLRQVGSRFFGGLRKEVLVREFDPESLDRIAVSLLSLKRNAPAQLQGILRDVADGNLRLNVNVSDSPRKSHAENQRARLLTLAIVSVSIALLLTIPNLPKVWGIPLVFPLSAGLVVVYLWSLVLWRKL